MKILVPAKRVPDPDQRIIIHASGVGIDDGDLPFVLNPFDAIAIEEALRIREENRAGGDADEIEIVTVGIGNDFCDVVDCEMRDRQLVWRRAMFAGRVSLWVALEGAAMIVTALPSALIPAKPSSDVAANIMPVLIDEASLPDHIRFESIGGKSGTRPDVTEATIVVSGGRAFKGGRGDQQ